MNLPFRLGTTSYIIPDDILPNARYLAGKVSDIELILFEVDDGPNNLPSHETIEGLKQVTREYDMTYTVHLPLDLKLGDDGSERDLSLVKAKRVMDCVHELNPWAYVLPGWKIRSYFNRHKCDPTMAGSFHPCVGNRRGMGWRRGQVGGREFGNVSARFHSTGAGSDSR